MIKNRYIFLKHLITINLIINNKSSIIKGNIISHFKHKFQLICMIELY